MEILKVVFVIIGTLIGAGFASGQEVYTFFFSYGIKGFFGIIISSSIIGCIIFKTLKLVNDKNIKNYRELLDILVKKDKVKEISNIVVNLFILTTFYVMIAGFGAYLKQEFNLNSVLGSGILAISCFFLLRTNIKGFVKVNEILIPTLILVVLFIRNIEF